jgi:hypothetical protein
MRTVLNLIMQYYPSLYRRGAASEPHARYGELNRIPLPWFVPLAGLVLVGFAAETLPPAPAAAVMVAAVALIGVPAVLGMTVAMTVFFIGGLRADRRRAVASAKS